MTDRLKDQIDYTELYTNNFSIMYISKSSYDIFYNRTDILNYRVASEITKIKKHAVTIKSIFKFSLYDLLAFEYQNPNLQGILP